MTKIVMLSSPVYLNCDCLQMTARFDKGFGGYVIETVPVFRQDGLISIVYGPEYFAVAGHAKELVIAAGRQSVKKQDEADRMLLDDWEKYAKNFLARIGKDADVMVA